MVVAGMLTEPVTRALPPQWQGEFSRERASRWIQERDAESTVLLATGKSTQQPVGLVILSEEPDAIRIGYVLSESAWGQGLATELVTGFVDWCRSRPGVSKIFAGVEASNPASVRVLEKSGFHLVTDEGSSRTSSHTYEIILM